MRFRGEGSEHKYLFKEKLLFLLIEIAGERRENRNGLADERSASPVPLLLTDWIGVSSVATALQNVAADQQEDKHDEDEEQPNPPCHAEHCKESIISGFLTLFSQYSEFHTFMIAKFFAFHRTFYWM